MIRTGTTARAWEYDDNKKESFKSQHRERFGRRRIDRVYDHPARRRRRDLAVDRIALGREKEMKQPWMTEILKAVVIALLVLGGTKLVSSPGELDHRVTVLETKGESVANDIQEIKRDVKTLLSRRGTDAETLVTGRERHE